MLRVYKVSEAVYQTIEKDGILFANVLATKDKKILSGYDHFIGNPEKARNDEIIHIQFDYTCGNYRLFYKGTNKLLKEACFAIEKLNDNTPKTRKQQEYLYRTLVKALLIVHHKNTAHRKSKLAGINSLSSSCCDNSFCLERMKNGDSVCYHCYSNTQQKTQLALQDRNTINGIILRNIIIPVWAWKAFFNSTDLTKFFRIESFGDIQNKIQAINYINFMKAFPRIHFAVWSKNVGIWHFAFEQEGKPKNCSFVYSSNKVNACELHMLKTYNFIDHVFTVFDKKYIVMNNVTITCGGRACLADCIKKHKGCYFTDTEAAQNEALK